MQAFNLTFGIVLEVSPIPGGLIQGQTLREEVSVLSDVLFHFTEHINISTYPHTQTTLACSQFDVALELSDISLWANLLLAVEKAEIRDLSIYQLLYSEFDPKAGTLYWPCVLTTLFAANFTDVSALLSVDAIRLDAVTGPDSLEAELDLLIDNTIALFVGDYNTLVTDVMYGFLQGPAKKRLNKVLNLAIGNAKSETPHHQCPKTPLYANTSYIKFDESEIIGKVDSLVNDIVGVGGMNDLINCGYETLVEDGAFDGEVFEFDGFGVHLR